MFRRAPKTQPAKGTSVPAKSSRVPVFRYEVASDGKLLDADGNLLTDLPDYVSYSLIPAEGYSQPCAIVHLWSRGRADLVLTAEHMSSRVVAMRSGSGEGNVRVVGPGRGNAIRSGGGDGHAVRVGGEGNAERQDEGNGHALRLDGDGNAVRQGTGSGCAVKLGVGDGEAMWVWHPKARGRAYHHDVRGIATAHEPRTSEAEQRAEIDAILAKIGEEPLKIHLGIADDLGADGLGDAEASVDE